MLITRDEIDGAGITNPFSTKKRCSRTLLSKNPTPYSYSQYNEYTKLPKEPAHRVNTSMKIVAYRTYLKITDISAKREIPVTKVSCKWKQ